MAAILIDMLNSLSQNSSSSLRALLLNTATPKIVLETIWEMPEQREKILKNVDLTNFCFRNPNFPAKLIVELGQENPEVIFNHQYTLWLNPNLSDKDQAFLCRQIIAVHERRMRTGNAMLPSPGILPYRLPRNITSDTLNFLASRIPIKVPGHGLARILNHPSCPENIFNQMQITKPNIDTLVALSNPSLPPLAASCIIKCLFDNFKNNLQHPVLRDRTSAFPMPEASLETKQYFFRSPHLTNGALLDLLETGLASPGFSLVDTALILNALLERDALPERHFSLITQSLILTRSNLRALCQAYIAKNPTWYKLPNALTLLELFNPEDLPSEMILSAVQDALLRPKENASAFLQRLLSCPQSPMEAFEKVLKHIQSAPPLSELAPWDPPQAVNDKHSFVFWKPILIGNLEIPSPFLDTLLKIAYAKDLTDFLGLIKNHPMFNLETLDLYPNLNYSTNFLKETPAVFLDTASTVRLKKYGLIRTLNSLDVPPSRILATAPFIKEISEFLSNPRTAKFFLELLLADDGISLSDIFALSSLAISDTPGGTIPTP